VDAARDRRLPALDGLRGLAALVVLLSHVVMAGVPALGAAAVFGAEPSGVAWLFVHTPLATVWAGPELVIVFFVLSGLVLTRALQARPVRPGAFLVGRIVRLYLPVWASLGLAAALLALVPRSPSLAPMAGASDWLNDLAQPVGAESVSRSVALVLDGSVYGNGKLNGVLWSLRWEVWFSLALPLLMLVRGTIARLAIPLVIVSLLAVDHGAGHASLRFLPPFAVGVVLALHEQRIGAWRAALGGRGAWPAAALALSLLSADLWLPGTSLGSGPDGALGSGPGGTLVLVGAALAVLVPLLYGSVARVLCTRPMQWLGSRSFSLYLVHFPIVLAFAYGLDQPPFGILLALALPTSLLAAEAFHRAIERPCHALARAATAQIAARYRHREPAPAVAPA